MKIGKLATIFLAVWLILNGLGISFQLPGITLNNLLALATGILILLKR